MYTIFTTHSTAQWTQPSTLQLSPELSILIIIAINQQFVPHKQISCTMSQIPKHRKNYMHACGFKPYMHMVLNNKV